jgi:hypothetical protein
MTVDTRRRCAASLLALLAVSTTLIACRARPTGETRLVYQHSNAPAAGLRVTQIPSESANEEVATSSADGRVRLYPNAAVTITDPDAGNCVLATFRTEASPPATLTVPEAIRIRGRVPADHLTDLRLQYGFGRRIPAGQRFRALHDRVLATNEAENRPLGLELPLGAASWQEVQVAADGAFTTGWFPAEDTPQIAAWNGAGRVAVEDVPLRTVTPRATLDAPALRFVQTRRIAITFSAPANAAAEIAGEIYVRGAQWRPDDAAFVARYLSVLDRIDARTFAFATMMRPFTFEPGETTIDFLPPWTSVDVRLMDAIVSNAADLTLPLSETSTSLDVKGERLLPAGAATLPLHGSVVLDRLYLPMVGATVVYSCYPDRYETTTDRLGNFVIPQACVGRESTVFVSATDQRYAPSQATQAVTVRPGAVQRLVIRLPERTGPLAAAPGGPPRLPDARILAAARTLGGDQLHSFPTSPFWTGGQPSPPDAIMYGNDDDEDPWVEVYYPVSPYSRVNVVTAFWESKERLQLWLVVDQTGTFDIVYAPSPCWLAVAKSQQFQANQFTKVTLYPTGSPRFWTSVVAQRYTPPYNGVDAGTAISFVNPIIEPDPVEIDATAFGQAVLWTCNWGSAWMFVADANMGCFENVVTLDESGFATIQLQQCTTSTSDSPPQPVPRQR